MYKKIAQHPGTRKLYADKLVAQGVHRRRTSRERLVKDYRQALDAGQHTIEPGPVQLQAQFAVDWAPFLGAKWTDAADTRVPLAELRAARRAASPRCPRASSCTPRSRACSRRAARWRQGKQTLDWGMAETPRVRDAARAEGYGVRLSGQDSGRGTFAHRHAVLHDQNRERWDAGQLRPAAERAGRAGRLRGDRLAALGGGGARLRVRLLDCAEPNELVIWEAQFGDFANGAQVVIDQFITSGEAKWGRMCGLMLFLPHGYEGQGPEHSSARLERYLQLCAEHNIQVCVPSDAGADLPPAAPADAAAVPQAAGRDDAEEPAAQAARRSRSLEELAEGQLPDGDRRDRRARAEEGEARRRLRRQGVLRPARRRDASGGSTTSRSCASSSSTRSRTSSSRRR